MNASMHFSITIPFHNNSVVYFSKMNYLHLCCITIRLHLCHYCHQCLFFAVDCTSHWESGKGWMDASQNKDECILYTFGTCLENLSNEIIWIFSSQGKCLGTVWTLWRLRVHIYQLLVKVETWCFNKLEIYFFSTSWETIFLSKLEKIL